MFCFAFITGCALKSPSALPKREQPHISYFSHTVATPGETFGHIAQWYTGDWKNWELIAPHNPDLDSKRIKVGDSIRIPESMLVKRTPLPKEQVIASQMRRFVREINVSGAGLKSLVNGMMSQFRAPH